MVDGTAGAAMPMFRNCLGQSAAEGEIYKVEREVVTGEIPYWWQDFYGSMREDRPLLLRIVGYVIGYFMGYIHQE